VTFACHRDGFGEDLPNAAAYVTCEDAGDGNKPLGKLPLPPLVESGRLAPPASGIKPPTAQSLKISGTNSQSPTSDSAPSVICLSDNKTRGQRENAMFLTLIANIIRPPN